MQSAEDISKHYPLLPAERKVGSLACPVRAASLVFVAMRRHNNVEASNRQSLLPYEPRHLAHHVLRTFVPHAWCYNHLLRAVGSNIQVVDKILGCGPRHQLVLCSRQHEYLLPIKRIRRVRCLVWRRRWVLFYHEGTEAFGDVRWLEWNIFLCGTYRDQREVVRTPCMFISQTTG